jgi:hypothetical protein
LRSAVNADQLSPAVKLGALDQALNAVRDNLVAAEAGTPVPEDQIEMTRRLTRDLDTLVVETERALGATNDLAQDLKMLAHQCKQMLAASWLIRKDASLIRLPEE